MRLGAVILSGGRSERMGRPKESLPFGATTMLGAVVAAVAAACRPLVVVRRDAAQRLPDLPPGVDVVADDHPGEGPLAALAVALRRLRDAHGFRPEDAAFATACDTPFVATDDVRWLCGLLGDADVVMPAPDGRREPLCAIYRLGALPAIERLLAAGVRTPRSLADAVSSRLLDRATLAARDPELRMLRNINTPDEYRALDSRR